MKVGPIKMAYKVLLPMVLAAFSITVSHCCYIEPSDLEFLNGLFQVKPALPKETPYNRGNSSDNRTPAISIKSPREVDFICKSRRIINEALKCVKGDRRRFSYRNYDIRIAKYDLSEGRITFLSKDELKEMLEELRAKYETYDVGIPCSGWMYRYPCKSIYVAVAALHLLFCLLNKTW